MAHTQLCFKKNTKNKRIDRLNLYGSHLWIKNKFVTGSQSIIIPLRFDSEEEEVERETVIRWGVKDGRLYNGGLIFHKVASHHQEKEISEIKNQISSTHGQKTLPPLNFLCSPPRNFNWRQRDRELYICILQTSAF